MNANLRSLFTHDDMQEVLEHWAGCRANGYIGSDYGGKDILQSTVQHPYSVELERQLLIALHTDVPMLVGYVIGAQWEADSGCMTFTATENGQSLKLSL